MPGATETEMHAMPSVEPATEAPAPLPETYGPPATETPAVEPTTPPAATQDDLFNTPSTEEKPLPVEEPATPSEADDFFNEPAGEGATDTAPSTPATEPAAPPAAEPAAESVTEPASTPTTEPSTQPTDDDLFAPPAEEKPAEGTTPPADEKKTEENDDLFGNSGAVLEQPGGLASHSLRHWVDNTGSFSCRGRMLRMLDGKVQLLKDNGRTTTVPLARLSKNDLEFVSRQASAQKAEAIGKTAQASNAWSN
jgi:hypothetical protein